MPSTIRSEENSSATNPANLISVTFNPTCHMVDSERLCKTSPCTFEMFQHAENMLAFRQYGDFTGFSDLYSLLKQILLRMEKKNFNGTAYDFLRKEFDEFAQLGLVQEAVEIYSRTKNSLLSHHRIRILGAFMTFSLPDVHFKLSMCCTYVHTWYTYDHEYLYIQIFA